MQCQLRSRPRLEVLEDRLTPSPAAPPPAVPLAAPESQPYGRSTEEWGVLYSQWSIEDGLGGGSELRDTVGIVRLLPYDFVNPTVEIPVSLAEGTPFVALPFFVFGERYDDPSVPDDSPQDVIDLGIFATADIRVVLNGAVLLEGTGTELLERYGFGPYFFEEPIVYVVPEPRGPDLNAVAAVFVQGIATVFNPLPVGEHTLVTTVQSEFFGDFQITYQITVSPR